MTEEELKAICLKNPKILAANPGIRQLIEAIPPTSKQNKYRNKKVYIYERGVAIGKREIQLGKLLTIYDSEKEYQRHLELRMLEKANRIKGLQRQVPFIIQEACVCQGERIRPIIYKADFCYWLDEKNYVEDVKGYDKERKVFITTKEFDLKWKLLKCRYPEFIFVLY